MESKEKEIIDLSKLPPKEELKELAKICKKLTEIMDNQTNVKKKSNQKLMKK